MLKPGDLGTITGHMILWRDERRQLSDATNITPNQLAHVISINEIPNEFLRQEQWVLLLTTTGQLGYCSAPRWLKIVND